MTEDHDLRSRLERLASSAGDPPEHGLDRVAARRHRRLHRRRGAVATATVLAVLAAALSLISEGREDPDTVAADEDPGVVGDAPVEEPKLVEVHCEPTGIVIPVASVRAQRDGLHLRVLNSLGAPTHVTVTSTSSNWDSGDLPVEGPTKEFIQPVPPGVLEIGCEINAEYQRLRVDLVDPRGYYEKPELACDAPEQPYERDIPVDPAAGSLVPAVRQALGDRIKEGDAVGPVKGYPSQTLDYATEDPQAAVLHNGSEMVALVHVRGADRSPGPPYTTVSLVVACPDAFATPTSTTSTTTTSSTTAPPPASTPAP